MGFFKNLFKNEEERLQEKAKAADMGHPDAQDWLRNITKN